MIDFRFVQLIHLVYHNTYLLDGSFVRCVLKGVRHINTKLIKEFSDKLINSYDVLLFDNANKWLLDNVCKQMFHNYSSE